VATSSRDEDESKSWNLRELASLVEGHFHEQLDISIFEAVERQHGFVILTPRIPGLQYRDLDDID